MSYEVYKLSFTRLSDPTGTWPKHVSLFITRDHDQPGEIFHVIDDKSRSTDETIILTYTPMPFSTVGDQTVETQTLIGVLQDDKFPDFRRVCESMPDVVAPQSSREPDCNTWLANVVYDLHEEGIVQFVDSFELPSSKLPLRVESTAQK